MTFYRLLIRLVHFHHVPRASDSSSLFFYFHSLSTYLRLHANSLYLSLSLSLSLSHSLLYTCTFFHPQHYWVILSTFVVIILSMTHQAVLIVHDTVAQKNFEPVLPPLPDDLDDELEEESVKIVRLVKNKEPLGATIRRDEVTGAVVVARIMRGGAADRSGLVHVGDELREVNGNLIIHKRPEEISQVLSQSQGSITLKIIPAIKEEDRFKESKVYLRALFDYTPFEDKATPCQEAGLPFTCGDILQVVSQDDPTWWQAKRVGDSNLRAGLIPSRQFQERYTTKIMSTMLKSLRSVRSFRLSRKDHQGSTKESHPAESTESEFLIYEEVTLYQMRPQDKPRLVVLIGSLGARINELKQKVIAENSHRYGVAVPHTTRPRKSHEKEGVEYNFISKQAFEADIQSNKYVISNDFNICWVLIYITILPKCS
uniref:MAGUK p55 subfamily member 3-like n=1 Tax=Sinocyclocheilus rhinocerous TaxID=307959 RepID=A0A673K4F1_9TELE